MNTRNATLVAQEGITDQDRILLSEMFDDYDAHAKRQGFRQKTIEATHRTVLDMLAFTGCAPWFWRVEDFDHYSAHLDDDRKLKSSTRRKYQGEIRSFNQYLRDSVQYRNIVRTRYKVEIQDIAGAENIHHKNEEEGRGARALSPSETEHFFSTMWSLIDDARKKKGSGIKSGLLPLLRDLCIFILAYHYGLRVHEAMGARVSKFSEDPNNPQFGRFGFLQVLGKASKGAEKPKRSIPITFENTHELLKSYMDTVRPYFLATVNAEAHLKGVRLVDFMFFSERGKPIGMSSIQGRFKMVKDAAGFGDDERVTFHSLRKSFATHNYLRGMRLETLRRLLGHAHLATTQIYLDLSDRHIQDDIKRVQATALKSAHTGDLDD